MTPNNQLDLFDNKNHTSPLQQYLEIEYIRDCFNTVSYTHLTLPTKA